MSWREREREEIKEINCEQSKIEKDFAKLGSPVGNPQPSIIMLMSVEEPDYSLPHITLDTGARDRARKMRRWSRKVDKISGKTIRKKLTKFGDASIIVYIQF